MVQEQKLEAVPLNLREKAKDALSSAFGTAGITELDALGGGASGALISRVVAGGRAYVMRMERARGPFHNPHQYVCMQTASDAGIAPPLTLVDAEAGVVIMDFIPPRNTAEYPGGPPALAHDLGCLIARLQATPPFPELRSYPDIVARMLGFIRSSGLLAEGLLDPHLAVFERIREACPWQAAALVSSHNDANRLNVIFDGHRLWLIDWETAYRNDAFVDVAVLTDNFAPTADLEAALLGAWLGRMPDPAVRARLTLVRLLTKLYYAGILLGRTAAKRPASPDPDLHAPTEREFRDAVAAGTLKAGADDTMYVLGKMMLAAFVAGSQHASFEEALAIARHAG